MICAEQRALVHALSLEIYVRDMGVVFSVCVSSNRWPPRQMFCILADREGGRKGAGLSSER